MTNKPAHRLSYDRAAAAILRGNEMELTISGTRFFIGCAFSGTEQCVDHTVYNEQTKELYRFSSRAQLINEFRHREKTLKELWPDVVVLDVI